MKYQHDGMYHSIIRARTEMLCDFVRAHPTALDARWHEVEVDFHAWALREGIDTSNRAYQMTHTMSNRSYGAVKKYIRENCIPA